MKTFLTALLIAAACATALRAADTAPAVTPATATAAQTSAAPMRIADLVAQTVAQNPELHFYENEIQFAKDRSSVSKRWADPELSVEIGRKSVREADGSFGGDGLAWGVTLAQKFDFSGRNALRKAIAERQVERAEAGLAQFRRELAAKTAELAHALLAAQLRLDAAEEVAARGRAMLDTLVQRDPAGVAVLLETRVIEADVLKLEKSAAIQRKELMTALTELNMLRGLAPETPLTLANDTTLPAPAPADSKLVALAMRGNFTLHQFELDLQEQGLVVDLERKNAYGDVTIAPFYSEERAGDIERTAGVGVSIPLPLWNANKPAVAEARTRKGQAENALFKTRRDLHKDIIAAARDYRTSQELLAGWGAGTLEKFRQAAELGDRHYRLGSIPVGTYLSLQQAYLDLVETTTSTRAEAIKSAAQLTILTGIPLETFFQTTTDNAPAPANANTQDTAKGASQ